MAKVYDKEIGKHIPWDGNEETGGLRVRGTRIEEFLKKMLDMKAGLFHYDITSNRYLVFADSESRDAYLDDPTKTELIIGAFEAPYNYSAEIALSSPVFNAVFLGSSGHYIDFTFDIKNKNGASTGENVNVTYTFVRNATKTIVKETRKYGESVHLNIDDYLLEGTNMVIVGIVGQNTLAATTVAVTYQVVNLELTDYMNISRIYNLTSAQTLEIPYTVSGQGTKIMEWYIDGELQESNLTEDEIADTTISKTKYLPIKALSSGLHHVQFRAYTIIGGERFYTDTHYREFIVDNGDTEEMYVAVKAMIPKDRGVLVQGGTLKLYGIEQYLPYTLELAVSKKSQIGIMLGDKVLSTLVVSEGSEHEYGFTSEDSGEMALRLVYGDYERVIPAVVSKTTLDIKVITDGKEFDFTAKGRNNSETNKDKWEQGDYSAMFTGFEWNDLSGWKDNALYINEGATLSFDYAPLSGDATKTGKTIEIEFATRNVSNDNAVICDLRNGSGRGLLITASEARLTSDVGKTVYTKFKSGERNRIGFVINPGKNVTNKGLVFIYVNGILSGAVDYSDADKFTSSKNLVFKGTSEAQVTLYSVLTYNTALTSSQELNNYILYRTDVESMRTVYDNNDILENGKISLDKARRRLPVMIITGDILELDEKSDTDTYVTVDIDYFNDSEPDKNFRLESGRIRIQGTSSRFYPRKNYRFYTNKADYSVLYDSNGNVVTDGLYAFKDGAQPVDCWCLKADFAESSGTHNTGVARIWNEVMTNASFSHTNILGEKVEGYPLRTGAQITAKSNGYTKDVRTTIDGFPILVFRRLNETDDLVFLGKYNFNNDKSTPSVFGFEGIPGFDNRKMQSWEFLENEDEIALFKTVDGFYEDVTDAEGEMKKRWELAFEARYTGEEAGIGDLYGFCSWLVGVKGNSERFATEKWGHMDVYKVAAYYVYLMRFGALDQMVKNCFITSEDGVHYYFINYDNDTILGVDNTGEISANPDVDRQSQYSYGSYVYAGHESVLWNMLEGDTEFMSIVRIVDEALYSAGLTVKNVLRMFNDEQSGKWVERVYNEDAQYKYIEPYTRQSNSVKYLSSLQGSRRSHRTWWATKRFSLYDSLYASGDFTAKAIEIKCISGTPSGLKIGITAGTRMGYGYGLNRVPRVVNKMLSVGESTEFVLDSELGIGTPVAIYAAPHLQSLNISTFAKYLNVFGIGNVWDDDLGTSLTSLILGNGMDVNTTLDYISGLDAAKRLKELDIRGFKNITDLDLSNQQELTTLRATDSGLTSVTFANGAPIITLDFPESMRQLKLSQLPKLTKEGVSVVFSNLYEVRVNNCPRLSNDFIWVWDWYSSKTTSDEECTLIMDNIDWSGTGVTAQHILRIANVGTLSLQGKVTIPSITLEEVIALREKFGDNIFDSKRSFWIDAPAGMFLVGPTEVLEGESAQYEMITFGDNEIARVQYKLSTNYDDITIDSTTGLLTTVENGSQKSLNVILTAIVDGELQEKRILLTKKARVYPQNVTIVGNVNPPLGEEHVYRISTSTQDVTGNYETTWSLTESDDGEKYAEIVTSDNNTCIINVLKTPLTVVNLTLSAVLKKVYNQSVIAKPTLSISIFDGSIAETDPEICRILHEKGLCANAEYITKEEARLITDSDLVNGSSSIFKSNYKIQSFEGFKHFTNVRTLPSDCFYACSNMRSITLPEGISTISYRCFAECNTELIEIPNGVTSIDHYAFQNCKKLISVTIPNSVTSLGASSFEKCSNLTSVVIPNSVTLIRDNAFKGCASLTSVTMPAVAISYHLFYACTALKTITFTTEAPTGASIDAYSFSSCTSLESIEIPEGYKDLKYNAFEFCSKLKTVKLPSTLSSIGSATFKDCSSLEEICIPKSAYNVNRQAFVMCGSVDITVDEENTNYCSVDGVLYNKAKTDLIAYAKSAKQPEYKVLDGVTNIASSAFQDDPFIEKIILPDSVLSLGTYCFYNCRKLHTIVLPSNITTIPETSFRECESLSEITIPASVANIGNKVFYGCLSLKTIYCLPANAPSLSTPFGHDYYSYTGRNTYNTKENKLYVPQGATGYDTGQWSDPLCNGEKCGFTLVYSE